MTTLLQLADIHFGTEDPVALRAFEATARELDADAMAVCGDLTQRGKRSEFEDARDWLNRFDMPKLVVPGNHDTPLLNLYERVASPFERHDSYFSDLAAPVSTGDVVLTGINTSRGWQARSNWAEGVVNLDELEGAISDAETLASPGMALFLVCHHPFLSLPEAPLRTATRRGRRSSSRLLRSRVAFLLTGHVHSPSVSVVANGDAGYVAIAAGTMSTRLRNTPASFNKIEFSGERCMLTVYRLQDGAFVSDTPRDLMQDFERHGLDAEAAFVS